MPSASDQIMSAIKAALIAGGTVAASRVFVDRVDPLQAHELPAILIDDQGFTSEVIELDDTQQRTSTFSVHCVTSHPTAAAPEARAIGLHVEKLIVASSVVQTLAHLGIVIISGQPNGDGAGDRLLATFTQVWQATYLVHPAHPEIINP